MKTKSVSIFLLLALLLVLMPNKSVSAQDPNPPQPVNCGLNLFCWAGQLLSGSGSNDTQTSSPSIIEQVFPPAATATPFRAPTAIPSHVATFTDSLMAYMNTAGQSTVYAYYVDAYGNINFRIDNTQTPASEQKAPDGSGKSLTEYLCYDPTTKTLQEWECHPDPIYGTWVYGQAGWYTGFLTTISINLADIYPTGHTTGNVMFYASTYDTGAECRPIANSYGAILYICAGYTSYTSVPTIVVIPTSTALPTATPTSPSLCGTTLTLCKWDHDSNTVSLSGNGWSQSVSDFIYGGPGTYPFKFTRVSVSTSWPLGTVSYCKNVYMPDLPEFVNNMGVSTREYAVCLYQ